MPTTSLQQGLTRRFNLLTTSLVIGVAISACGGGVKIGSNNSESTSPTPNGVIILSGTAATGAPMSGAKIEVKDSLGSEVCNMGCLVNADGSFAVRLNGGVKGPFVLRVQQDGDAEPQVSMIDTAQSALINVSPITTLIAARLAPSGDPAKLVAADVTGEKVKNASAEVKLVLKPLLDAVGVASNTDLLTAAFKADSIGIDKALDVLGKPSIERDNTGKATVVVELKTGGSDEASDKDNAPAKITFKTGSTPAATTGFASEKIAAALPVDGIGTAITVLLRKIESCYGTAPLERRPSGATLGSEITATACKEIFIDNDPTKYLHNNVIVSRSGATLPSDLGGRFSGAFTGIFYTVQGIKFDLPEYRYTIKNGNTTDATKPMDGDVVFTARWTVTDPNAGTDVGQTDLIEYHARLQSGRLKLVGNQSKHDLNINPVGRRENLPALEDYSYVSTGYTMYIGERRWNHDKDSSTARVSIYEKVVITSPSGTTFTLKPIPGNSYDYLGLVRADGTVSPTATTRLNGFFQKASTAGHPSDRFPSAFWGDKNFWTDEVIASIPAQGNWKFEVTLTDAFAKDPSNGVANQTFVQYRRALNRAPTLAEMKMVQWPDLTESVKNMFTEQAKKQGYVIISSGSVPKLLEFDGWVVPTGAWAPTSVKIYGSNWDEGRSVSSTARKTIIYCNSAGSHCEKSAGGANTGYFINTGLGYLQLNGRDSKRILMSNNYETTNK